MLAETPSAQQVPTLGTVATEGRVKGRADRTRDLQGRSGSRLWSRRHSGQALRSRRSRASPSVIRTGRGHTRRILMEIGHAWSRRGPTPGLPLGTAEPSRPGERAGACALSAIIARTDRRSYRVEELQTVEFIPIKSLAATGSGAH